MLYYELKQAASGGWPAGYYKSESGYREFAEQNCIADAATRVWYERDNKVVFNKNTLRTVNSQVDLQEFMWVKLRARMI